LTITATNKTKVYGAALPALTTSYSGFVNGDLAANLTTQAALSTTATATSHVSGNPYTITASGAADADYTISYVSGSLTVTPVSLTITADSKSKVYGAALPSLTASYSGFVNGDTAASLTTLPTLSTTATASSPIGNYSITVRGTSLPDYTIKYLSGTLTVYPSQNAAFLMPDSINPTKQALYVFGTAGNDLILINPGFAPGYVTVTMNGKSLGTFNPTSRIIAHGLAGNDYIGVSNLVTLPAWLYGDDGNDVLWGGGGPNILMGGAGKDNLYGGTGRSLLIGGTDSDTLAGGIGDAILIGKNTNFDANDLALSAIMNEWNSAANYATRAGHITGKSGGLNGSYFLNATTIRNDIYKDALIGSSAMDLYFQGFGDTVNKKKSMETMITLSR
jgi:Ca2+-binding RTX toxin-like protein